MVLIHSSVNLDQCHLGTRKMQVFLGNQNHARQIIDVYVLKRPFSYVKGVAEWSALEKLESKATKGGLISIFNYINRVDA